MNGSDEEEEDEDESVVNIKGTEFNLKEVSKDADVDEEGSDSEDDDDDSDQEDDQGKMFLFIGIFTTTIYEFQDDFPLRRMRDYPGLFYILNSGLFFVHF